MALSDLKHDELDELAATNNVEDYPSSGNKDDKVAALENAGVAAPATDDDTGPTDAEVAAATRRAARTQPEMVVIDGVRYRPEDASRVQNKARTADRT